MLQDFTDRRQSLLLLLLLLPQGAREMMTDVFETRM